MSLCNSCYDCNAIEAFIAVEATTSVAVVTMEQHTLKIVNNSLKTNIYSYLEISVSQSFNIYLSVVHFFNTSVNETSVAA